MTRRATFLVSVDLDEAPGMMHTVPAVQNVVRNVLFQRMAKYNPAVALSVPPPEKEPKPKKSTNPRPCSTTRFYVEYEAEAEEIIKALQTMIDDHGHVSLHDLVPLIQMPSRPSDNEWGWTSIKDVIYHKAPNEWYLVVLPEPQKLTNNTEGTK